MKKIIIIAIAAVSILFITALIINPAAARTSKKAAIGGKPIPAAVMKIAEKSCLNCHADHGNIKARTKLNLNKWDSYTAEKQAEKAKAMCNDITKAKMPPAKYREKHPEDIPTPAEIRTICEWAKSIQASGK